MIPIIMHDKLKTNARLGISGDVPNFAKRTGVPIGKSMDISTADTTEVQSQKPEPAYDYCSTQINMPEMVVRAIKNQLHKFIDPNDLYAASDPAYDDYGIEDRPHATVLFGILKNRPEDVADLVDMTTTMGILEDGIHMEFGDIDSFEPSDDYDVLILGVKSRDLRTLNNILYNSIENASKFGGDNYTPHITLAYIKKNGAIDKYLAMDLPEILRKMKLTFKSFMFCDKDGKQTRINCTKK